MTTPEQPQRFDLTLAHLLTGAGIEDNEAVLLVRHTYKPDGLRGPADMTLNKVLAYTREQNRTGKFPANPPSLWLTFIADGGRRSRFVTAYENLGMVDAPDHVPWKQAQSHRWFDLRQSELLASLRDRLVIEWTSDTINWAKSGRRAEAMRVVEIADPEAVAFPGFDRFVIDYPTLQAVIDDSRYSSWRTALAAVQGIYLIADKKTGKLYVGKADGSERFLAAGRPMHATGTAATSCSRRWRQRTPPTPRTISSRSCGSSTRPRRPQKSTQPSRITRKPS